MQLAGDPPPTLSDGGQVYVLRQVNPQGREDKRPAHVQLSPRIRSLITFVQARRDRSGWKRWQRAAICIGMGIALIAFIGVVYSEKEDGSEKSMFTVHFFAFSSVFSV